MTTEVGRAADSSGGPATQHVGMGNGPPEGKRGRRRRLPGEKAVIMQWEPPQGFFIRIVR